VLIDHLYLEIQNISMRGQISYVRIHGKIAVPIRRPAESMPPTGHGRSLGASGRPFLLSCRLGGSPLDWNLHPPPSYQSPRSSWLPPIPGLPLITSLFLVCASNPSRLLVNVASNRWHIVCCAAIETWDNFVARRYLDWYGRATHLIHPLLRVYVFTHSN
jgi:hypothetical protein